MCIRDSHWGKVHGQRAGTLSARYPAWAEFLAARERLDPGRTFANPYLERVLAGGYRTVSCFTDVSYTHLDVYKRQSLGWPRGPSPGKF